MLHREMNPRQTNEFSLKFSSVRHRRREVYELVQDRQLGRPPRPDDDCVVHRAGKSNRSAAKRETEQTWWLDILCMSDSRDPIEGIVDVERS